MAMVPFNATGLRDAVRSGDRTRLGVLLSSGADPNLADEEDGTTALHILCQSEGDDRETYGLALMLFQLCHRRHGPLRVDARDASGRTPLSLAASTGHRSLMELLLRRGADPDLADAEGSTPLHAMCAVPCRRHANVVALFFEICDEIHRAVRIDARDNLGQTPLHVALLRGLKTDLVNVLLSRGADPNAADAEGSTPLHVICKRRKDGCFVTIVFFFGICGLVGRSVRVDALDNSGRTPLQLAVAHLKPGVARALFNRGAELRRFEFPTAAQFQAALGRSWTDIWLDGGESSDAAGALEIVRHLAGNGYALDQDDAMPIMRHLARRDVVADDTMEDPSLRRHFFRPHALILLCYKLLWNRLPWDCCEPIVDCLTNRDMCTICLAAIGFSEPNDAN